MMRALLSFVFTLTLGCFREAHGPSVDAAAAPMDDRAAITETAPAPPQPVASPQTVTAYLEALARTSCGKVFACCNGQLRARAFRGARPPVTDVESCVRSMRPGFAAEAARREREIARGVMTFSIERTAACLVAITDARCERLRLPRAPAPCDTVFQGRVMGAQPCTLHEQCSSGYCVPAAAGGDQGSCALASPCFWREGGWCPAGTYCEGRTGACLAPRAPGEGCSAGGDHVPCAGDKICLPSQVSRSGASCRDPGGEGTGCAWSRSRPGQGKAPSPGCLPGLQCGSPTSARAPVCLRPLAAGSACADDNACSEGLVCYAEPRSLEGECRAPGGLDAPCLYAAHCRTGFHCQPGATGPRAATCQPRIAAGGPCAHAPDGCAEGLYCDQLVNSSGVIESGSSTCRVLNAIGGSCAHERQCASGAYCAGARSAGSGRCAPPAASGAACTASGDCRSGLYCDLGVAGGICQPKRTTGQPCAENDGCAGRCFDPGSEGGLCYPGDLPPPPAYPPPLVTFGWPTTCSAPDSGDDRGD